MRMFIYVTYKYKLLYMFVFERFFNSFKYVQNLSASFPRQMATINMVIKIKQAIKWLFKLKPGKWLLWSNDEGNNCATG